MGIGQQKGWLKRTVEEMQRGLGAMAKAKSSRCPKVKDTQRHWDGKGYKEIGTAGTGMYAIADLVEKKGRKYVVKRLHPRSWYSRGSMNFLKISYEDALDALAIEFRNYLYLQEETDIDFVPCLVEAGSDYIVLDYIDGEPFDRWMKNNPRRTASQEFDYVVQIIDKAARLNEVGFVSCDMHYGNILLANGEIYYIDFGTSQTVLNPKDFIRCVRKDALSIAGVLRDFVDRQSENIRGSVVVALYRLADKVEKGNQSVWQMVDELERLRYEI
jgi:serine/threonine protein kinase